MKKRTLTTILTCIGACMFLAGCGDTASSSGNDTSKGSQELSEESQKISEEPQESSEETKEASADTEKERQRKKIALKKETNEEAAEEKASGDRKGAYQEILYKYKEAQDGQYTAEDVERMGIGTELVQHGWPLGATAGDVKYLYYDVDSDGNDELIITYYNEIIDIYGYDGEKVRLAFSTPYRGIAEIHPDGMLELIYSISASDGTTSWYQYDTALGDYLEVYEYRSEAGSESYFTFGAYNMDKEERRQVEQSYRDIGTYPVWLYEWSRELTETEYEKIVPTTDKVRLPDGELISNIALPDDYEYAVLQDNTHGQETADTIEISKDMQKKLNIFLSNFAEQGMAEFDYGRPDAGDLADFAYLWTYINKWTDLDITTDGYYTLSLDKVENVVNRFMDITLTDDDLNSYTWPNVYQGFVSKGRYCVRAADGESYDTLAIVTSLSDEGANNYRAQFDIYDLDSTNNEELVSLPPKFYSYNAAEAGSEPNLIKAGSGYAIIRKDGDSYKLKYYDTELLKDGNEIERPGMTGSAEKQISGDPLEGLVASDILAKYRESNPLKSPDSIEKEAFALGDWVQKSIKNIPAATREKGETIGRRYEFWFGTDVGNNFDANFPRIYSAYYSLKDYYTSDGSRSKEFYEGVCEENDFMGNGNPENIEKMYIDMQSFVTDCNNIIRKK